MDKKKRLVDFLGNGGSPLIAQKIGRNDFCRCGSGKKAKRCCGTDTRYYLTGKAAVNKRLESIVKKDKPLPDLIAE